jgi:hypothetical protein
MSREKVLLEAKVVEPGIDDFASCGEEVPVQTDESPHNARVKLTIIHQNRAGEDHHKNILRGRVVQCDIIQVESAAIDQNEIAVVARENGMGDLRLSLLVEIEEESLLILVHYRIIENDGSQFPKVHQRVLH